jgi:hypothetical protein
MTRYGSTTSHAQLLAIITYFLSVQCTSSSSFYVRLNGHARPRLLLHEHWAGRRRSVGPLGHRADRGRQGSNIDLVTGSQPGGKCQLLAALLSLITCNKNVINRVTTSGSVTYKWVHCFADFALLACGKLLHSQNHNWIQMTKLNFTYSGEWICIRKESIPSNLAPNMVPMQLI